MMGNGVTRAARRRLLGRGALLAAGAATVGWLGGGARRAEPVDERPGVLRLKGRGWHLLSDDGPGSVPRPGDRLTMYGELVDGAGQKAGEFYSACFCVGAPFGPSQQAAGNLEFHTLNLSGGSITGMGTAAGAENVYAIVGGTGEYVGATGSYVARQQPYELGGDGTAEFVLTLTK